jgi:NAD(P)-dependent dehydrogenase (short-subunit alcohol dehydrogenase family)
MNIFLTGASGYIGGSLAVALQKHGHSVRGLTRNQGSASDLKLLGIDPVVGDLDDSQLLEAGDRMLLSIQPMLTISPPSKHWLLACWAHIKNLSIQVAQASLATMRVVTY